MSWTNIGLIFVAGLDLGMAVLMWLRNPRNKINISFAIAIFFLATWTFGVAMFREVNTLNSAWFWTWVQNGSGALMVVPFFIFSIYFPYQNFVLKTWHKILIFISIVIVLLFVFIPGAWVRVIFLRPHDNYYNLNRWGIGYFALHFYFYLGFAFVNLIKKYLSSSGFIKDQLKYIIFGCSIISFFGSIFGVIIPLISARLGPYWFGPYFSVFMIIFLVYFGFYYNKSDLK